MALIDFEGRVIAANDALGELLGLTAKDVSGTALSAVSHPDDLAITAEHIARLRHRETDRVRLTKRYMRGEEVIWADVSISLVRSDAGKAVFCLAVIIDVTSQREAESQLRSQTERYETMLTAISDLGEGLVITEAGKMIYGNQAYVDLTGYTLDELADVPSLIDLAPEELRADLQARLVERLQGKVPADQFIESQLVTKDGRVVDVESSIRMLPAETKGRILAIIRDITDRKKIEASLQDSKERMRVILENVGDGIVTCSDQGVIETVNPAVERLFGYGADELVGTQIELLIDKPDRADFVGNLGAAANELGQAGASRSREMAGLRKDHKTFRMEVNASTVELGHRRMVIASFRDVSERRAYIEALEYQALHDALTGLPNRALFADRVNRAIARAQRRKERFGLLLLDLDRFKDVNDTLGHPSGDALLSAFADRLRLALRGVDTVARLGGDEFAILPEGIEDVDGLVRTARKIQSAIEAPFTLGDHVLDSAASIGIAVYPEHGVDANTLVQHADVAMYVAKRRGTGSAVYSPEQDEYSAKRLALLGRLRHGIGNNELVLHYQPQVNILSGGMGAVEALVRWQPKGDDLLLPDHFLPQAEQSELMRPLTVWVLNEALGQLGRWRADGLDLRMSVNVSARNLQDADFITEVAEVLEKHAVTPSNLTLEITESTAMSPSALDGIRPLHQLGVRLAIDDFGTGYSSLAYLKRLPVSELKIDKAFITNLAEDADDAAIVRPTVTLAHNLGLKVVAEGLENQASRNLLISYGCDLAQGNLIAPPLVASELEKWVVARGRY